MRHPCRVGIARIIKIIGFPNWGLENWFQAGTQETCVGGSDNIINDSRNRWADSNNIPVRSRQTENLIVDPIGQNPEFILQVAV